MFECVYVHMHSLSYKVDSPTRQVPIVQTRMKMVGVKGRKIKVSQASLSPAHIDFFRPPSFSYLFTNVRPNQPLEKYIYK